MSKFTDSIAFGESIRRFGNDSGTYLRFLRLFTKDPSFDCLKRAIECGDPEEAFRQAHTMKGLCAQLGLYTLLPCLCRICDDLRDAHPDHLADAAAQYEALVPIYRDVIRQIHDLT